MSDDNGNDNFARGQKDPDSAPETDAQAWERLVGGRAPQKDLASRVDRQHFVPVKDRKRVRQDSAVRRLGRRVRKTCPWISDADAVALRAWAELELLCQAAFDKLRREGVFNPEGTDLRGLVQSYERIRRSQLVFSRELGLTPSARAAVGGRRPMDLASAMAELMRTEAEDVEVEDGSKVE